MRDLKHKMILGIMVDITILVDWYQQSHLIIIPNSFLDDVILI